MVQSFLTEPRLRMGKTLLSKKVFQLKKNAPSITNICFLESSIPFREYRAECNFSKPCRAEGGPPFKLAYSNYFIIGTIKPIIEKMPPLTVPKKHVERTKIDLMYRNMQSAQKYEPYYYYTRYPAETTKLWNLVNLFTTESWMWTFLGKTLISNCLSIQIDGAYRLGMSLFGIFKVSDFNFEYVSPCTNRISNPLSPN